MPEKRSWKLVVLLLAAVLAGTAFPGGGAVHAASVSAPTLVPNVVGVPNGYQLDLALDGTVSSTHQISLTFDGLDSDSAIMTVPQNVQANWQYVHVQVAGVTYGVTDGYVYTPHQVTFSVAGMPATHQLRIIFDREFGLLPRTTGAHTIAIVAGSDILTCTYTVGGASPGTPVTLSSVTLGDSRLGVAASATLVFSLRTGDYLTSGDSVYVKYPIGFGLPSLVNLRNASLKQTQASRSVPEFLGQVQPTDRTLSLRLPDSPAVVFDAASPLTLTVGAGALITNPQSVGTYTFELWTSRNTSHATFSVTLGTKATGGSLAVAPLTAGAPASYVVGLTTSAAGRLVGGRDVVYVEFPVGFALPGGTVRGVTVNGAATTATSSGVRLAVTVPQDIAPSSPLRIGIPLEAGLRNGAGGSYTVRVWTTADAMPVELPPFQLELSRVSAIAVSVLPPAKNAVAAWTVSFTTGPGGALKTGDTISVFLPYGFMVPSTIPASQVTIKSPAGATSGIQPASVACSPSAQSIVLTVPSAAAIAAGATVSISLPAVITNPATGGTFTAKVSTSKETTAVDSQAFTVYNNPVSTLTLAPAAPDGRSSTYVTQPSFVLSVDGPAGTTLSAFYKLDDAATFTAYDLKAAPAVKVPEGRHAIAYYAQDNLGNVEPVRTQQVAVDLTDPVIAVASPVEGGVVVQPAVSIMGRVTAKDSAGLQLTVGGKLVSVASDGAFTAPVTFDHEGVNTVELVATSPSGRTGRLTLSVNYIARVTMSLVIGSPTVNLNNEFKTIEAAPFISKKGVTMVPLRFISEAFKANVAWDPVFKSVTISMNGRTMRIQVGYMTADVNGKSFPLQDAPAIVNGRTFVPLRFIAENFGAQVDWNGQLKMVSIIYPKP
jgi:hypothetical protein